VRAYIPEHPAVPLAHLPMAPVGLLGSPSHLAALATAGCLAVFHAAGQRDRGPRAHGNPL